MEAKDTVMSVSNIEYCFCKTEPEATELRKVAEFQADRTDDMLKEQRKQEGRKEVVELLMTTVDYECEDEDGSPCISFWFAPEKWQAKLKEWGIG